MITYIDKIKAKISKEFDPEKILLINNSSLHTKHKSFDAAKLHLKLIIKSEKLRKLRKIDAHRVIFSILKDEMKDKIHSLEIKIK